MRRDIERTVAQLAREGLTVRDIGAALRIDPRAVAPMMPRGWPTESGCERRSRVLPGYPRAEFMRSREVRR